MTKSNRYTVFLVFIVCFLGLWSYSLFAPVITQENGATYYLRPGTSKPTMISDLAQLGIIRHPWLFAMYVYPHKSTLLKTGEYRFPKGSTPHSIWKQISTGTGFLYHPLTIVPGWTFKQLRAELLKAESLKHLTATLDDKQIMERLGHAELSPEGEFFPDTYNYTRGDNDLTLLKRAFDVMQLRLQEAWQKRATNLPYNNSYEALVAASLIEKEGYLDSERPIIAGVLVNRLNKNMLLQIDATVIFGLGDRYNGKIYKENLTEDTPYNTYVHKGLPLTPIAIPGLSSIQAALHPQQNNYFYYVAKGNGSHQFSNSLEEHHEAVQAATNPATPSTH